MDQIRIKEIEGELWSAADALHQYFRHLSLN